MRKFKLLFLLLFFIVEALQSFSQCTNSFEPNNSSSTATTFFSPPLFQTATSRTVNSMISSGDQDWYSIGLDMTGNLTISLTNLPTDYDVELYGINGLSSWFAGSYNTGTASEQIVFTHNTPQSTVWYLKVYGKTSSNFSTACYTLSVSWVPCSINYLTPSLNSPGTSSFPGTTTNSLTPTLDWQDIAGATSYGVYIRLMNANGSEGPLIYDQNCITSVSNFNVPSGVLQPNTRYRWNVAGFIGCGSCKTNFPSALYFTTPASCTPVSIANQPQNQVANTGSTATFSVSTNGASPFLYFWYKNGTQISGANNSSYTTPTLTLSDNGNTYYCIITNCNSSSQAVSDIVSLTVNSICNVPSNQASSISFTGNNGASVTANWSVGMGSARIVKVNTTNSFSTPSNGVAPSGVNNTFQNTGEQIVYYGSGNSVNVNNLIPGQTYYFRVYEANCTGSQILYNSNTNTGNPASVLMTSGQLPIPDFLTPNQTVVTGQSTTIFDQSSNATSISWTVDRQQWNGAYTTVHSSTQTNLIYNFPIAACYRISQTVTNASGSNTLTRQCYVYATPNLNAPIPEDVKRAQKYYTYKGGDPVNLANGSFSFSMRDFSIPGIKGMLNLERRYFSNSNYEGVFGKGWHHSLDIKVNFSNAFDWSVQYPDGHNEHFVPYQNGQTRSLYPGNFDTLSYTSSGGIPTSFSLIQKDGIKWNFNSDGQITSIVDLDGNQTVFNYSAGKLTTVTLPGGRYLQFTYNAFNRVSTVTDNINRVVYFYYNATGLNLDSTRIENSTTSFRYGTHGMTEIYDPRGNRILQNIYNYQGEVFEQYDAENRKTSFQYNTPSIGVTTLTNPLLINKKIKHDDKSRCVEIINEIGLTEKFAYSLDNTLDTITSTAGFKTILHYDVKGNTIKTINAKGFTDSIAYSILNKPRLIIDKEGNEFKTEFSATGNPTHIILPTNDTIKREYDLRGLDTTITDPRGFKTRKLYNSSGDLIQITTPTSVTTFSHDAVGRLIEIVDNYGRKDSLFWNYFDQIVKRKDKMGFFEEFGYDGNGNLISYTDKEGRITLTEFNKFDKPVRVVEPQNYITETEYDDNQKPIKIRDPNKNTILLDRDQLGRVYQVKDSVLGVLSLNFYDVAGNVVYEVDGLGKSWTKKYDQLNRVTSVTNPLGDSVQYKYNKTNQVTEYIDEEGKSTKWEYDALSRHFKTTDAMNNYVQLFYNKIGLTDSIQDARGNIRNKASYDGSGRLLSLNDGFGNYSMTWDSTDVIKTITDPDNRTIEHLYNANNELTDIKAGSTTLRHYQLNNNGEYFQANSNTQNLSVTRNQMGWISEFADNYTNTTGHQHDSVGQVTKIIYPGGKIAEYTYNSLNKCIQVKDWNNRIYTINRDRNGGITSILYPNNYKTEIIRDDAYRIKAWINTDDTNNVFQSNLLRLSKTGNVERDSGIHVLPFIPLPVAINGVYDVDDRMLNYDTISFLSNNSGQRIAKTTANGTQTYSWSVMGELDSTSNNGATSSMQYDAFNERVVKNDFGVQNRFIVNHYLADFPLVLQERNSDNQELVNYLYIPGEGILLGRDSGGVFSFHHHTLFGNTAALSNLLGAITDRYEYGILTDTFYHAGTSTQPATWMGMYGVQHDGNGLHYLHARYYDGKTGTFISKDPNPINYLNTQDIDRYVYGFNNPLKFIDPTGFVAQNNISYNNLFEAKKKSIVSSPMDLYDISSISLNLLPGLYHNNLFWIGKTTDKIYTTGLFGSINYLQKPGGYAYSYQQVGKQLEFAKTLGKLTNVADLGISIYQINKSKEVNADNGLDAIVALLNVGLPQFSLYTTALYFIMNSISKGISGKDFGQNLDELIRTR